MAAAKDKSVSWMKTALWAHHWVQTTSAGQILGISAIVYDPAISLDTKGEQQSIKKKKKYGGEDIFWS